MVTEYAREQFIHAAGCLPRSLCKGLQALPEGLQARAEEIRLRAGRPMTLVVAGGEVPTGIVVSREDLELTLEIVSQASTYAVLHQLKNGFITVRGGHRLGICGTGVMQNGEIGTMKQISSLALRVAREVPGAAVPLLESLQEEGRLQNTLILSPPGRGKTTLLRDLARCVSDGQGITARRVGLADERGELAAMYGGLPQMNIGAHTDVVDGCPKSTAMLMLLRGMNPQVLAFDEITAPEDVDAIETALGCGVTLLATAHAGGMEDLRQRTLYRRLLDQAAFHRVIFIDQDGTGRRLYRVESL